MPTIQGALILDHLTVGPFQTNVYVVGCATTRQAAIIDGGGDAQGLLTLAQNHDLTITQILQTHAHIDHVAALPELRVALPNAPIALHPDDQFLYESAPQQGQFFGFPVDPLPKVDTWLAEGDVIEIGDLRAQVLLMPGHSPGSVIFYFEQQDTMVSGDVIFFGSMGRVDLPGADPDAMRASLKRLRDYPDATRIYSGHGPDTSMGREKQHNAFLTQDW